MGLRKKIKKFLYQRKFHKNNFQLNINNKNILVTGGNSGIGLALTKNLSALNNKVISTYRDKSFSSPVTGSVAPIHHTPWAEAMDDSSKTFLNK